MNITNNKKKACFLCGETDKNLTKEHIFPKWLLKKYNLYDKKIKILLNETTISYRNLTIPCCLDCNGKYLSIIEDKMKKILQKNRNQIQEEEEEAIFLWGAKIFYGLLYKELELAYDRSKPDSDSIMQEKDLDNYKTLHFLLQGVIVPTKYIGKPWSIFKFNICDEGFDYYDNFQTYVFAIWIGKVAYIICLEDGNIQQSEYSTYFSEIRKNIIHPIQFRELIAKINYKEYLRIKAPTFITIDHKTERLLITKKPSGNIYNQWDMPTYGKLLKQLLTPYGLGNDINIDEGKVTSYLFKNDGSFNNINN
ncbi:hypothetical protein [Staphylococcus epidermidis]|uniref:hypothetical protein n=1 Tax=Staphylococcus epidermidis TaxID=1282 RepID=UPI0011A2EAA0|nr:hypothetical protein [Staphylococcus epidermidis]MBM0837752.1 hypothetical protein [Staphylococcus epidermidis]MBM0872101.1 hypothetical protein [Staphylococcus epidermidis]QGY85889.1 hypothetical protein F1614_07620 [Staphylococcus epidermidis]